MVRTAVRQGRWQLSNSERQLILFIGDLVAGSLAAIGALALWAQRDQWLGFSFTFVRTRAPWFVLLPFIWILLLINLYDVRRANRWRENLRGVLLSAFGGSVLYLALYFTSEPGSLPRRGVLYFLMLAVALTLLWRLIYVRVFTAPAFMRRTLIVGAGESGRTLLHVIRNLEPQPFYTVGLVDDDQAKFGEVIEGVEVLGDNTRLLTLIEEEAISDVLVAILGPMNGEMFQALLDAQERGVQIIRMPVAYEELIGRVPIEHLESDWLLRSFVDELRISRLYLVAKRGMDVVGSVMGLVVFLLFLPWIALATMIESGRPIFFLQDRIGKAGRIFQIVKLRTMRQDAEPDGQAQWANEEGDPRTTRVGQILRRTHLDEFPQFWNVMLGEMSLVGPRPERPEFVADLEKQIPFYRARHLVKPGVTGWAQVNYGKGASFKGSAEKLEFDLYYIKHRGLLMDLRIIVQTIGTVLGLRGV
jgi:exopolysaccharide biosynthesis polyprenyl glycosylphosphotransferase